MFEWSFATKIKTMWARVCMTAQIWVLSCLFVCLFVLCWFVYKIKQMCLRYDYLFCLNALLQLTMKQQQIKMLCMTAKCWVFAAVVLLCIKDTNNNCVNINSQFWMIVCIYARHKRVLLLIIILYVCLMFVCMYNLNKCGCFNIIMCCLNVLRRIERHNKRMCLWCCWINWRSCMLALKQACLCVTSVALTFCVCVLTTTFVVLMLLNYVAYVFWMLPCPEAIVMGLHLRCFCHNLQQRMICLWLCK